MNEKLDIRLWGYLPAGEGWGASAGAAVHQRLARHIGAHPPAVVRILMSGVRKMDTSFARASIAALIKRYQGSRPICLTELGDLDVLSNIAAAAECQKVPVAVWNRAAISMVGPAPSAANEAALSFALARREVRAAEFAQAAQVSIANASTRFKHLWQLGYLMRSESHATSGGVEYVYRRIG